MKLLILLVVQQLSFTIAVLHQAYLDVEPVDTARFLDIIRAVNISTYRLSYERSGTERLRVGATGSELVEVMPEAVELIPKRVLPPLDKGGEPVVLHNIPVVNENTLFMFGVGATKELISKVDALGDSVSRQIDEVAALFGETTKLEHLISQSSSKEAELQMKASIAEAEIAQYETERELKRSEEEKDYIKLQRRLELEQIKQNEELTLSRLKQEEETAQARTREEMVLKFEGNRRIERSRNYAAEEISKMQFERDIALQKASEEMAARSAKAIAEAKAEAERANEDVHIRKLKAEAEQSRKKNIAAINAVASHIASSLHSASKNPRQVLTFIWYMAILATGIYTSREVAQLCRVIIESTLGKPKLIRETTRKSLPYQLLSNFIDSCMRCHGLQREKSMENCFSDVALESDLKNKVLSIASSSNKVRKNDAPHRHILFFGPPGTGKTMVARKMAKSIGMDYALMSGGDVGPLGSDAVTQIHNLFRWAKFSKNGVLLFIDEAEAFLSDRSKNSMSENAHNALNALLYNTGSERRDFMMVLATNRAEDLDAAILDRCDESLLFPLPNEACRYKLIKDYYLMFVCSMVEPNEEKKGVNLMTRIKDMFRFEDSFRAKIEENAMDEAQMKSVVKATAGFSGREIAKLMIALQGAIYASSDGALTCTMIDRIVTTKVEEHKVKLEMTGGGKMRVQRSLDETERPTSTNKASATDNFSRKNTDENATLESVGACSTESRNRVTTHEREMGDDTKYEKIQSCNKLIIVKKYEACEKVGTERTTRLEDTDDDLSYDGEW